MGTYGLLVYSTTFLFLPSVPTPSQHAIAGSRNTAPSMFTKNIKASKMPMSAWNFSAENAQVPTPIDMVTPVKTAAVPRWRSAS